MRQLQKIVRSRSYSVHAEKPNAILIKRAANGDPMASPSSGDLSDDFTDDFHISGVKEKAEIPDKYKEFRLLSSSGRET